MPPQSPEVDQRKPFSGMRVLIAVAIGAGLGLAVAYFLKVLIDNSPAEIALGRLRLFYLMVISSGGLGGFAIETMRQLQEEATDPAIGTARLTAAVVPEGSTRAIKKATPLGGFCMSDVMVRVQVITVG